VVDQPSAHNSIAYLQLRRCYRTHEKTLDPGLRRDDDFEAKFFKRHHMQVMTVIVVATVKLLPSSRRRPGSSVFRHAQTAQTFN
jgi:hypothetical protein